MTQTILIAGATGTNGRELIAQLAEHDVAIRALVRDLEKAAGLAGPKVQLVQGDLADPASLDAAMAGVDIAYVVTAVVPEAPQLFSNFYAAAKKAGVGRVVKFSGLGAAPDSGSELIRQHAAADQELRDSGLSYTIIRPNSFHQNMFWQAEGIKLSGQFYLPLAEARQSTIDVRDIAAATVKVMLQPGHENKDYDLTGPESLSFAEVAATLSEVLGKPVSYVAIPVEAAEQAMKDMGMPEWNAHALAEIQGVFATGKYADTTDDLEQILGHPGRTFRQFAEDFKVAFGG